MIAALRKSIGALKKDREHGAGWLTLRSLEILREAASLDPAESLEKLVSSLDDTINALLNIRPSMVSIANYALFYREELESASITSRSPQRLKKAAFSIAERLIRRQQKCASTAARNAAALVGRRSIIMTCSYSSAVCSALEMARRGGKDFKVLAVQSQHRKVSYGDMVLSRLQESGISGSIVPDNQIVWQAARADLVLCGADTVSQHGWFLNGTPSLELARTALRKKRPFYVVCETNKIDARGLSAGLTEPEPGFDLVPLELLSGLVTERGMLQPADIYRFSIEELNRSMGERPH
jgi:translation initiation factor 2B subunit (eIF-2B alpha/beta/delta family)